MNKNDWWKICMENQKYAESIDFSHLKNFKIPLKTCPTCGGTGYRKQDPGYYGLCKCHICNGKGKVIGKEKSQGEIPE